MGGSDCALLAHLGPPFPLGPHIRAPLRFTFITLQDQSRYCVLSTQALRGNAVAVEGWTGEGGAVESTRKNENDILHMCVCVSLFPVFLVHQLRPLHHGMLCLIITSLLRTAQGERLGDV